MFSLFFKSLGSLCGLSETMVCGHTGESLCTHFSDNTNNSLTVPHNTFSLIDTFCVNICYKRNTPLAGDEADISSWSVLGCFIDCGSDCASMLIWMVCRATVEHTVVLLSARLDQITHAGCRKAFSTFGTLYRGLRFRKSLLLN